MLNDLSVTPVSETLRQLASSRRSGDLQVRSGKLVKTVFFDHGRVVFAASNLRKDRLGEALVALGRITDEDFNRASALMKSDRKRRFGEALVQAGVLDRNEVGRSVARQVNRIVLSLFEMKDGAAAFEDRRCAIPLEYMVSLSVHRILYEGIRCMSDRELVTNALGNLDRWVKLAAVPPFTFDLQACTEEEMEVLEHARRRVTVRRLAWAPGGLAFSRLRAAYGFLASGLLEPEDAAEGESKPVIQMETGTFLLSALRRRPDPTARQAIRQEVDEELQRSAKLDREAWLKVSRTAPREELIKALEEKMERYHDLLDAIGDDAELKTDIEVIIGRASAMVRLTRQAPAEPTPPVLAADQVAAAPPDGPPPPPAETPSPGADVTAVLAAGMAENPLIDGQIEHLLMEGEVRMTVSDYANAVQVYDRLVQLAPKVAAFRTRLAIAMACYPRTAKQAEREFLEALRLDPDNADIHYQFGLYYKAMRQRARALAEMRTAVRLSPRHRQARQELEALSPRDSALTSLKKLFR